MAAALVPLQNITVSGTPTTITFASIPTTGYRDLRLVVTGTASTNANTIIQFNSDANNANYSAVYMLGNGSSASSGTVASRAVGVLLSTGVSVNTYDVLDYAETNKHKTTLIRTGNAGGDVIAYAYRWASLSAINNLVVGVGAGTFNAGTTLALYGVKA